MNFHQLCGRKNPQGGILVLLGFQVVRELADGKARLGGGIHLRLKLPGGLRGKEPSGVAKSPTRLSNSTTATWCEVQASGGPMVKNLPASAGETGWIPGSRRPLEKDMATHSSILACEILWTEEPGGLQSLGSQRVVHD